MIDRPFEVKRRAEQFCASIESMNRRAHEEAEGSCYMIFSVQIESEGEIPHRFIQFSFEKDIFHMDLPSQTLLRDEAEQIRRERNGFFYLSEGKEFTLREEDVEGHDPFRAVYFYGDEKSAADDMAFILFTVWRLPLYSVFTVTAEAFSGKCKWEQGQPLET